MVEVETAEYLAELIDVLPGAPLLFPPAGPGVEIISFELDDEDDAQAFAVKIQRASVWAVDDFSRVAVAKSGKRVVVVVLEATPDLLRTLANALTDPHRRRSWRPRTCL
jgi:hypothetical protein